MEWFCCMYDLQVYLMRGLKSSCMMHWGDLGLESFLLDVNIVQMKVRKVLSMEPSLS